MARNPRLETIGPSLIREIAAQRNSESIDLGLGEPTLRPRTAFFEAALQNVQERGVPYSANAGDRSLREQIAAYYDYPGCREAENVCITHGSQEALHAIFQSVLDPETDDVLVVEPAFGSYVKLAHFAGITARTVGMDPQTGFSFDAARILAAIDAKTRMLVLCSPCNPTGRVLERTQAEILAAGLRARGGEPIIVLFDEVYRELTYVDNGVNFAELYQPTLLVNSLSKSNALTGLRLGWAIGPADLIDPITRAHSWATSTASTHAQYVAAAVFAAGALREQVSWYAERAAAVRALLQRFDFEFAPLDGTFYAFVHIPGMTDSVAAALKLVAEDNVLAIPGRAFGDSSEAWLRLSYVAPLERIEEGLRRIKARLVQN